MDRMAFHRTQAWVRRLGDLFEQVEALQAEVEALRELLAREGR